MNNKYTLLLGKDSQYYFNLKAPNSEIILQSEGYTSKQNALKGIESVRVNSGNINNFDKRTASDGSPYFVLIAQNSEIIGKSEMYSSEQMRDNGIISVMKNGATTNIVDKTRRGFSIIINKKPFNVNKDELTGSEILALAGLSANKYSLFLIKGSKQNEIKPSKLIEMQNGLNFQAIVSNIQFG